MPEPVSFLCGPYLLAPSCDSMTVVWETNVPCRACVSFARGDEPFCAPFVEIPAVPDAPLFRGKQLALYRWTLENLTSGTVYRYRVRLEDGPSLTAGFRTLPQNPERLRLLTLSDSHAFSTRDCFNRAVWEYRPDFILHSGDLVEGTGAQAEQFSYFLRGRGESDFIHWFPILYAEGNHDQGGEFFDAYISRVQDSRYGASARGDCSMDCGGLHVILMNSSPWGLGQMNAESSGLPAAECTLREIDAAKDWLRLDLAGERAKSARFRVLVLHHPYSDAYTARHVPPIAEPGRVDLLLAGHTHSYARCVSENPSFAAGTVYITQQDARMYSERGNFCVLEVDFTRDLLTLSCIGQKSPSHEAVTAQRTCIAAEKQRLSFDQAEVWPKTLLCGGTVTVRARVTNQGRGLAAAVIPVDDNGTIRRLYRFRDEIVLLEPGESALLEAALHMEQTAGRHTLRVGDSEFTVEVGFRPACFVCGLLEVRFGDGLSGSQIQVRAEMKNIGLEKGTREVAFQIDGQTVETSRLSLDAGKSGEVRFSWKFERAGIYEISVGGAVRPVCIEGGIQGMPIVRDRSGKGHSAVIHGTPKRGFDEQGRRTLILDGYRDYLEIADDAGLHSTGGLTGMVWAKLPGSGTARPGVAELTAPYSDGKGMIADHNPLLIKGIGLGWGTSYQFRMAVRDNGKVAYGVCFEDDNGEFGWNDCEHPCAGIRKDQWVQYVGAFDTATGGDSYENGFHSAHVDPPVFDAPIKNWPGVPLRVGLGFKNKVLPRRGRGMYHTMLPGEISQVRYYRRKLTETEILWLLNDPDADNLLNDLDADNLLNDPDADNLLNDLDADNLLNNPDADNLLNNPDADNLLNDLDADNLPDNTDAGNQQGLQVHLRFEDGDLELRGCHTTEWVRCQETPSRLVWTAEISGGAQITVRVQFSGDGKTVCREQSAPLSDGRHTLTLEPSGGRWVRLCTEFLSVLGETVSAVPVLREYVLEAGREYRWNTLESWRKGSFSGAVGHQDSDVYRDHNEDLPGDFA